VLLERGLPLGVVTAIAGSSRYLVELTGLASHAGTTPMDMRRDAAAAAAEIVLLVEAALQRAPRWSAPSASWRCPTARST
jgi:N-carbamoyl-L-amino-acid hydrolase